MQRKLLGIINVDFDAAGQLLIIRELTIKLANSPPCACRGSTKPLVWFDDVDTSAFHSCVVVVVVVVVDLWQSLSEWNLLMSACVLVCRRENVGA
jgi:hypothetical protein